MIYTGHDNPSCPFTGGDHPSWFSPNPQTEPVKSSLRFSKLRSDTFAPLWVISWLYSGVNRCQETYVNFAWMRSSTTFQPTRQFFFFFLQPAAANLFLHKSFRILKRGTTGAGRVENYHRAKMKVAINRLNSVKHGTLTGKICSSFFFLPSFIPFFLFFLSSFYLRFPSSSSLHTSSLKFWGTYKTTWR